MKREGSGIGGRGVLAALAAVAFLTTGCAITRVSVSSGGAEGNGASSVALGVSDDGRFALFASAATNLVGGDTNGAVDVFRRDETTEQTVRVDVGSTGAQLASGAAVAAMTPDGRYVAFVTADGIDPGDTNAAADVYVRDVVAGTTTLASVAPAGGLPPGDAKSVAISADARFVAFMYEVREDNEFGFESRLLRRDRQAGATTALTDWGYLNNLHMSRDARHFTLQQRFVRGFSTPVLLDTDGSAAGWPALQFSRCPFDAYPAVSPDGRFVLFAATGGVGIGANCLPKGGYLVDRTLGTAVALNLPGTNSFPVAVSRGARAILFMAYGSAQPGGDPAQTHIFLRDRVRGNDARLDFSVAAQIPDASTTGASLSDDGTAVAFVNAAPDLVPDDHNGVEDVFVRETGMPPSP